MAPYFFQRCYPTPATQANHAHTPSPPVSTTSEERKQPDTAIMGLYPSIIVAMMRRYVARDRERHPRVSITRKYKPKHKFRRQQTKRMHSSCSHCNVRSTSSPHLSVKQETAAMGGKRNDPRKKQEKTISQRRGDTVSLRPLPVSRRPQCKHDLDAFSWYLTSIRLPSNN